MKLKASIRDLKSTSHYDYVRRWAMTIINTNSNHPDSIIHGAAE